MPVVEPVSHVRVHDRERRHQEAEALGQQAHRHFSRRQFLQTTGVAAGGLAAASFAAPLQAAAPAASADGFRINIASGYKDAVRASAPVQWAVSYLREALIARGLAVTDPADLTIELATVPPTGGARYRAESFALSPDGKSVSVSAADVQGYVFGLTELADRVRHAASADAVRAALLVPAQEEPANGYRGTVRIFVSETEDKRWFYDREGWQRYFDMLVTHRFNHFNLSFGLSYDMSTNLTDTYTFFMYPFFVDVPGYKVHAIAKDGTPLPGEEQKKNLDTLKFISDQAALRGLKFTLGIWTHSFRWSNSPNATYRIDGLDAQSMPLYSRDALKMLIGALPNVTGINLRTHGESGVAEGNYDFWKIIMSGLAGHKNPDGTNRLLELDLHGKSLTVPLIDIALATGMPLLISCKLWAEHMGLPYMQASIRESEMPKDRDATGLMAMSNGTRSLLRYGIGDLLTKDRKYKIIHRVWPGSQKLLLWGDPLYAAEYGRAGSFAGIDGIDFFDPLSFRGRAGSSLGLAPAPDRGGYADASLRAERDWEKYLYTFRLWGRLSYNPDAAPETWQRQLSSDYGPLAPHLETALANSSRILPLITTAHDPAAAGDQYWPEMYTNQSLYNTANCPYSEAPSPKVFGNISSLDPQMFATVNEYVDSLLANKPLAKISPLALARQLETWSAATFRALADSDKSGLNRATDNAATVRRAHIDAAIAAGLGQFFAGKFRAAVLWQIFNLTGHEPARDAALDHYKQARTAWATLADSAKAYLPNLTFGIHPNLRGHWLDRLAAIDADIAGLAAAAPRPRTSAPTAATINTWIQSALDSEPKKWPGRQPRHLPPDTFKPGDDIRLRISGDGAGMFYYRHVNQGERYVAAPLTRDASALVATIPGAYSETNFPIEYYFEFRDDNSALLHPGFEKDFTGTPYFLIRPA